LILRGLMVLAALVILLGIGPYLLMVSFTHSEKVMVVAFFVRILKSLF